MTFSINDTQYKTLWIECLYAECHYAKHRNLFAVVNVIMLNVVMLSFVMQIVAVPHTQQLDLIQKVCKGQTR